MGGHPALGASTVEAQKTTERYYFAQCLKDETMAEAIADAYRASQQTRPAIVHVNGAFHSDYGQGTAARVKRRLPRASVTIVSIKPVADLDTLKPSKADRKIADYLVFTTGRKGPGSEGPRSEGPG